MRLFNRMKDPVFLNESKNSEKQLQKLKELKISLSAEGQAVLQGDINRLEYGIAGEKNIEFELRNSHIPMYILHDIYLEVGDLSAQIDYLVFTRKLCFVIESKNLYGNIDINNAGDFVRTIEFNGRKRKEGIYSPITQNQRHIDIMKKILVNHKRNYLTKSITERVFDNFYKPIVVLANPKTVLNTKFAKKEAKENIIRADQLVKYIKDTHNQSKEISSSDKDMLAWAQSYLNLHKDVLKDYSKKYEPYKLATEEQIHREGDIPAEDKTIINSTRALADSDIFNELREYRLDKSREEKIKAYYIYSDNQLRTLISEMPRNKEELQMVAGFGEVKIKKYGDDILRIIQKYSFISEKSI